MTETEASVLDLLAEQLDTAWSKKRPEEIIGKYVAVRGKTIIKALVSAARIGDVLKLNQDRLAPILASLERDGYVMRVGGAGEEAVFAPTPLGYWLARRGDAGGRLSETASRDVLGIVTRALQTKWADVVATGADAQMPEEYAYFLLFMLVGGAVGREHPLRWPKKDVQDLETARALLQALSRDVGWSQGAAKWSSQDLVNFVRRNENFRRWYGASFHKEEKRNSTVNQLYFEIEPTVEAITPLMRAVEDSLGTEQVVAAVSKLDKTPWTKTREFASAWKGVESLFGRHQCPSDYRATLLEAARRAASETDEEGVGEG